MEAETVRSCADIENNKAYDLLREENSRLEILLSESNQVW